MLTVRSSAFSHNGEIPKRYTSQGEDLSPPLAWSGAPAGTKSFVLIVDDPDAPDPAAPKRVWVHWLVIDIPPAVTELAEGLSSLPPGARSGKNDWNRATYGGPAPPIGRHRYFFKLYALDRTLELEQPTKAQVEKAMQGHILGHGELVGTYQKS
jgi:Raf kinase inhibitor-like YbhB/YbcL family protein